jgi:hypothetical protein
LQQFVYIIGRHITITECTLQGTLGDYISNYHRGWATEHLQPKPVLLDFQYKFKELYLNVIQAIKGFTRTIHKEGYVRAFKVMRNPNNNNRVELYYKAKPEDKDWLGFDKGLIDGFTVLSRNPGSGPKLAEPCAVITKAKYLKEMEHKKYQKVVEDSGLGKDALKWCRDVAASGNIPRTPVSPPAQNTDQAGLLGPLHEIGVDGHKGTIQVIEPLEADSKKFWWKPAHVTDYWRSASEWRPGDAVLEIEYKDKKQQAKVRACVCVVRNFFDCVWGEGGGGLWVDILPDLTSPKAMATANEATESEG